MTESEYLRTKIISILLLAMVTGLTGLVTFWNIDPRNPVWNEKPVVHTYGDNGEARAVFAPGETVVIEREYCKAPDVVGVVRRSFEDGSITALPTIQSHDSGGCGLRRFAVTIPRGLYPGEYLYRVTSEYRINPIKTRIHRWTPVPLTIKFPAGVTSAKPGGST